MQQQSINTNRILRYNLLHHDHFETPPFFFLLGSQMFPVNIYSSKILQGSKHVMRHPRYELLVSFGVLIIGGGWTSSQELWGGFLITRTPKAPRWRRETIALGKVWELSWWCKHWIAMADFLGDFDINMIIITNNCRLAFVAGWCFHAILFKVPPPFGKENFPVD